jgi:hypothetical protein
MTRKGKEAIMTTYTKGYRAGWLSYLEECCRLDSSLSALVAEADTAAEYASHGLLPQGDYWLGYYHGRAAAKTRVTLHLHTSQGQNRGAMLSLANG